MLSSVDMLIFDIDGVLIDTGKSFPEVIRRGIIKGFEVFTNGESDFDCPIDEHYVLLKRHGHFNDDYEISWFLTSVAAASGCKKLSEAFPSIESLRDILSSFREPLREWVQDNIYSEIPYDQFRNICFDLYTGKNKNPGLFRLEVPQTAINWKHFGVPIGIYTGRDNKELTLALKTLGWEDFPREFAITSSSGITKPNPKGIEILCKLSGSKTPCFFGDTASDLMAHNAFGSGMFVAIGDILNDADNRFDSLTEALQFVMGQ